jgi:Diacylglycerol kinase catalytic domain
MTTMTRRWVARASFALMLAAVALLLAVAGWRSLTLAAFAVIGVCAVLAGGYWFLASRGLLRWLALVLVIAAPVLILVAFALHSLLWVAVVAVALMVAAAGTARAALSTDGQDAGMPAVPAARPRRPFLIMNPRSGGGKVTRFGLQEKAEALGAEVALLQGPGTVDVAALARQAVAGGADLLGVAGGDGTQALVAGLGRRARLDAGTLGVVAVRVDSARQAAGLIRRGHGTGLTVLTAEQVTVDADAPQIPVGIDGETVMLPTPVRCAIRPRALRVVVPRQRPGVPAPKAALEWPRLRRLASFRARPDGEPLPARPGREPSPQLR